MNDFQKRRGPRPRGNVHKLTVELTAAEYGGLTAYCERENITQAEAVRRMIRATRTESD